MTPLELKNTRKSMGLTQARLAELIGVTDSTVARWEMGVHPISFPIEQLLKTQIPSGQTAAACGWTDVDLSRLAAQARQAFEQLRLKKCLVLTKLLLQVDPENKEAHALESSIRSALQQDLQNARELLEKTPLENKPQEFGKGAEIVLWRVLNVDPKNEEAKALLSMLKTHSGEAIWLSPAVTESSEARPESSVPLDHPEVDKPASARMASSPAEEYPLSSVPPESLGLAPGPFGSAASSPEEARTKSTILRRFSSAVEETRLAIPIALAAVLLTVVGVLMLIGHPNAPKEHDIAKPSASSSAELPNRHPAENKDTVPSSPSDQNPGTAQPDSVPPDPVPLNPVSLSEQHTAPTVELVSTGVTARSRPVASSSARGDLPLLRAVAAGETGTLHVNSLLAAEIYMEGEYVGSTPATLDLPAGTHTLEYRHQDLRRVVTHVVRAGETTAASITFEVRVQINAKPWAQVFLEGAYRQPLGQTPLSGIVVPAGSTLVFENPNFPRKNYRVTGTETAIQVVFP